MNIPDNFPHFVMEKTVKSGQFTFMPQTLPRVILPGSPASLQGKAFPLPG